jgi:4-amino-4-deoxy-L-arabinose transferase-like glycosyltransferase
VAATLAVLCAARVAHDPVRRNYLLTGAAVGLAASAKYNAAVVAVALVAAHLLAHRRPLRVWRPLIAAACAAVCVFAIFNIGAVIHPVEFVRNAGGEGLHYSGDHFGNEGNSPAFNAGWLWQTFGVGLLVAALSFAAPTERARRTAIVAGSFVATYFVFLSAFPVRFARNLLPLTGSVAALVAIGVFAVACLVRDRVPRRRVAGVSVVIAIAASFVLPSIGASAAMRSLDEDPWSATRHWIDDNVPEGSTVAVEAWGPYVDPERYRVVSTVSVGTTSLQWLSDAGVAFAVLDSQRFEPFFDAPDENPEATALYELLTDPGCVAFEAEGAGHRLVVSQVAACTPSG